MKRSVEAAKLMSIDILRAFLFAAFLSFHFSLFAETSLSKSSRADSAVPRIEWNRATLSLIQTNGRYGRIIRLKNGEMLCGFDFERKIYVRHSRDEGKTWETLVKVAEKPSTHLTNTELLQLRDGTVLCLYNERPRHFSRTNHTNATPAPFTICMARSTDNGETWQTPELLFTGGAEFTNGCWEPAAIQLPSGEVQLFFSNESPYRDSDEQEITLMRSKNGGRDWSGPEKISFRAEHRDGMPSPLVLQHGRGIAFAIEDNGQSGNFKPVIVFSTLKDNWRSGTREPGNDNRWGALRNPPPPHVAASAPCLRQMPSGETVLSFQQSETGELKDARMTVCIGNDRARDFVSPTNPFPATNNPQLWNSLFIKNRDTIVAVSETTINGISGIWSIEGRFIRK